jgi:beta-xylosidase
LQKKFGQVGIRVESGKPFIVMVNADTRRPIEMQRVPLAQKTVYLKAECDFRNRVDLGYFYYSLDGKNWTPVGNQLKMEYTLMEHFMGYRFGLFNYATQNTGGFVDFDFFHIEDPVTIPSN